MAVGGWQSPDGGVASDRQPARRRQAVAHHALFGGRCSPGGATIINAVFNVTLNLIDHRISIQQAINAPRFSVTSATGTISCEGVGAFMQPKFSVATQDYLRGFGHPGLVAAGSNGCLTQTGSVQGVVMDLRSGRQYGGTDPRRDGTVIGLKLKKAKGRGRR